LVIYKNYTEMAALSTEYKIQTAIISLYSINLSITEGKYVYCAVKLNHIKLKSIFILENAHTYGKHSKMSFPVCRTADQVSIFVMSCKKGDFIEFFLVFWSSVKWCDASKISVTITYLSYSYHVLSLKKELLCSQHKLCILALSIK
jgi:hypothetical protein